MKKLRTIQWSWALIFLFLFVTFTFYTLFTDNSVLINQKNNSSPQHLKSLRPKTSTCNTGNKYEAIRRLETNPGYRKARQIIRLPYKKDLYIPDGFNSAWNYCGCRNNLGVDCEFGVGFEPYCDKWILYAATPEFGWHYVENGTITFYPGEIITLILEVLDNKIRCTVYDGDNQLRWDEILPARGLRSDCSNGEKVRIMSTLVLNQGKNAYSRNNRRFSAIVSTPFTEHQFDGKKGIVGRETKDNDKVNKWIKIDTFNPYYNENISLEISTDNPI